LLALFPAGAVAGAIAGGYNAAAGAVIKEGVQSLAELGNN